ncbi:transketolase [bacterium]|nr:MAG: transketolase [bacterium]
MLIGKGFKEEELSGHNVREIRNLARQVRTDILKMAQLAGGWPVGGSLSVVEALLTIITGADIDPADADNPKRDRIVVSQEQAVPAYYAALGRMDFFDLDDAIGLFRKAGSIFEGRLERSVPGVEWGAAPPGQAISVACGLALSARWQGHKPNIFVLMSDEEQQRGEIGEARRFAKKYRLNNITAVIDANNVQVAGKTSEVMPQNVKYEYIADGWDVIEINGHDPAELYQAVRRASQIQSTPVLVIANTTMGAGVSFMENQPEFYSRGLTEDEFNEAIRELGESPDLTEARDYRTAFGDFDFDISAPEPEACTIETGFPRTYAAGSVLSNIDALGAALVDVGEESSKGGRSALAVFDCAHGTQTGLVPFAQKFHDRFLQCGLSNRAAATVAAAMSIDGVCALLTDFGIHSIGEVYGQLRNADHNRTSLKIVATHLGLDAGSDGKGLHCIDYIGIISNLFGYNLILPADPNETDRALRFMLAQPGNWVLGINSSTAKIITDTEGNPVFAGAYEFKNGGVVQVRPGEGGVILSTGHMLPRALKVWETLDGDGMAPELLHIPCPLSIDRDCCDEEPLLRALRKGRVITYEDHNANTGLGARVANVVARRGISCRLLTMGVTRYSLSGDSRELYRLGGLDPERVAAASKKFLKR